MSELPARKRLLEKQQQQKEEDIQEEEPIQKDAWKNFDESSEAGKLLRKLYGSRTKPQINYPAVKTKKTTENRRAFVIGGGKPEEDPREKRLLDTNINVPKFYHKSEYKFYPIDFVQRKRLLTDIKREWKEIERDRDIYRPPLTKEVSTKAEIERLQLEYQFKGGKALPECISYPAFEGDLQQKFMEISERKKVLAKPVGDPDHLTKEEYNILFDEIMTEIDERQKYLVKMMDLGNRNLQVERRIKSEIDDRITDLERLDQILESVEEDKE